MSVKPGFHLTRREFLKLTGITAAGLALAGIGCSPKKDTPLPPMPPLKGLATPTVPIQPTINPGISNEVVLNACKTTQENTIFNKFSEEVNFSQLGAGDIVTVPAIGQDGVVRTVISIRLGKDVNAENVENGAILNNDIFAATWSGIFEDPQRPLKEDVNMPDFSGIENSSGIIVHVNQPDLIFPECGVVDSFNDGSLNDYPLVPVGENLRIIDLYFSPDNLCRAAVYQLPRTDKGFAFPDNASFSQAAFATYGIENGNFQVIPSATANTIYK